MKNVFKLLCLIALVVTVLFGSAIIVYAMGGATASGAVMAVNPERAVWCTGITLLLGLVILFWRRS